VGIVGSNLAQTQSVMFGPVAAQFQVVSDSELSVTVPDDAPSVPITVVTPTGSATSADRYEVMPVIGSYSPQAGPIKTMVTLNGSGFIDVTSVKLGTLDVPYTVDSYWTITFKVIRGSKTGKIFVQTKWGRATSPGLFTLTSRHRHRGAPNRI
jgi:hypothetical protein